MSDDGQAVLADFGLSTAIDKAACDITTTMDIRKRSTLPFCAPELLLDQAEEVDEAGQARCRSKTTATDIYAFGMLILQVSQQLLLPHTDPRGQAFTGQQPWAHLKTEFQIITSVCVHKKMHPRPEPQSHAFTAAGFSQNHWHICLRCWAFKPHERPSAKGLSKLLEDWCVSLTSLPSALNVSLKVRERRRRAPCGIGSACTTPSPRRKSRAQVAGGLVKTAHHITQCLSHVWKPWPGPAQVVATTKFGKR